MSDRPSQQLAQRLRPFAGPFALLAVATLGLLLPFVVASNVISADAGNGSVLPPLSTAKVIHGRDLYMTSCIACHAADAKGVANLGKDLTTGYAMGSGDAELIAMITRGRQPGEKNHTSAVPMPPKGGRPDLTRNDIADIVAYLRGVQDPSRLAEPLPTPAAIAEVVETDPTPVTPSAVTSAAPGTGAQPSATGLPAQAISFNTEAAARGKRVYASCMACHGKTGTGMPNVGADLLHSTFVAGKTDAELVAFIKKGRLPTDPDTRLKLSMPPKGGNPALKDNQLEDVVAYLRSLQAAESASR